MAKSYKLANFKRSLFINYTNRDFALIKCLTDFFQTAHEFLD